MSLPGAYLAAIAEFTRAPDVEELWLHASVAQPLQKVLATIRERNSATLRIGELAAAAGMSSAALSQAFRRAFGHSLKFHMMQDLLQRALHELTGTNKTVRQIAMERGYSRTDLFCVCVPARLRAFATKVSCHDAPPWRKPPVVWSLLP